MTETIREQIEASSVPDGASIRDALAAINLGGHGLALLVGSDGVFAGLVTDGDVRRALLAGRKLDSPVSDIERPAPTVGRIGMSPDEITALLTETVRVLPLLDDRGAVADLALLDRRVRLPVAEPLLGEKELEYVTECVQTGWVSSKGRFVGLFEERFAEFCGTRHAVSTSNGTCALHLALLALGVGPGDEVIVPTLTFIATANTVVHAGASPVFVDSEPETWNLDAARLEEAITERTRAIVPVHLYGHPADMDPILEIAERHGLPVLEDAAEAHGARYKGRRVGSIGRVGVFSFYGNKILTTGEGGMLVTDDDGIAERARVLRNHGMSPERRYWHPVVGFNYRLTNLQAALGVAQMERIDDLIGAKRRIAARYAEALRDVPGIVLPPEAEWAENVFWLYSILIDEERFGLSRDELMEALDADGVETRPLFPPIHTQPVYAQGTRLPVAEHLADHGLSLPSAVGLDDAEVDRVAALIAHARRPRSATSAAR